MKSIASLLAILLITPSLFCQKNPVQVTSAKERWEAFEQRKQLKASSLIKNIPIQNIGPTIMSGRVVDLEVDPKDPTHFYVAFASGGLWETTNNGISFHSLFDHEMVMTIGDIAVDWKHEVIYIGTGENNSSRSSYAGFGIYSSNDNGKSWKHLGLEETHHIGRIVLHPNDPKTIWVASLGHLYSENKERGVFKTTDGGESWKKTLYINPKTGIVDLAIHPDNPLELIAAAWERDRKAWNFSESGPGSGLYKSNDGGNSWFNISAGDRGFPDTNGMGRVGLSYAPSDPDIIYTIVDNQDRKPEEKSDEIITKDTLRTMPVSSFLELENNDINDFLDRNGFPPKYNAVDFKKDFKEGKGEPSDLVAYLEDANAQLFDTPIKGAEVYISENGGTTWNKTHEGFIDSFVYTFGYYFGQIRVDPNNKDLLYIAGVPLLKSTDGGANWESILEDNVHVDHHALWINPKRPGHLILGNDGGINISYDDGLTWNNCNSIPVGQFYSVNVDMDEPYHVYGGLQDNGVWKGPNSYTYSRSWLSEGKYPYERLMGGDGMQIGIDTRTNDIVYAGYQFGNYYRINTTSGEHKYITPKHEFGERPFRWNWQSPLILSSHNQDIIYLGSNKFHRSMDKGGSFETLSGDLTLGGKPGDVSYGTLTSITESPLQFGLLYASSDDGLIHISKDAGETWTKIISGLPANYWVSRVHASNHDKSRVYTALNGYRWDCFDALIFRSDNYGESWQRIGTDLPKEPVNVIKEDPENENILYVGTDHGLYVSLDRGARFMSSGNDLPAVAVHDLVIQSREKDLIIGTHGRSIYKMDVSVLQQLTDSILNKNLHLFPPDEITHNENWGMQDSYYWEDPETPSMDLIIFSLTNSKATVSVMLDTLNLKTWNAPIDRGLNYLSYDVTYDSTKNKELKQLLELKTIPKKDNQKYYLRPGTYKIIVATDDFKEQVVLNIKEQMETPRRKGSE